MALAKILGLGDLAGMMVLILFPFLPHKIIMWVACFLILKGLMFAMMKNTISYIDVAVGAYIVLLTFGVSHWLPTIGSAVFLGQKGLFSLV